ncbi:MAG: hypothetical protein RI907_2457 [Pseudomonadota bacterium]|jgi:peptidoglycan/LPS O-acetylase OafA/YrhL
MNLKGKLYPSLDGLRGLAILMVIAHNGLTIDSRDGGVLTQALYKMLDSGWIGVVLFFALSGFLITGILLDNQGQPHAWRNFMARRALRIFPPYYLTLFILLVALPFVGWSPPGWTVDHVNQVWLWTYLINWPQGLGHGVGAVPHFWSLAIEEQFYLVWPVLILACRRSAHVLWLCLAVIGISVGARAWMAHQPGLEDAIYVWTVTRMDALAYGALAAWWIRQPGMLVWFDRMKPIMNLGVLALLALTAAYTRAFPRESINGFVIGYAVLGAVSAYAVVSLARGDLAWPSGYAVQPWMAEVGRVSYGMYIVHKPLHDFVFIPFFEHHHMTVVTTVPGGLLYLAVLTLSCYGVARLSYDWFEGPILRLKQRFA